MVEIDRVAVDSCVLCIVCLCAIACLCVAATPGLVPAGPHPSRS